MKYDDLTNMCMLCGKTHHNGPCTFAPSPPRPNPRFHETLAVMAQTHDAKSKDYATPDNRYSNFEFAAKVAGCSVDTVFRVLLGIKLARLKVLLEGGKTPTHESVQDSKLDLATYAALWASYEAPQSGGPQST